MKTKRAAAYLCLLAGMIGCGDNSPDDEALVVVTSNAPNNTTGATIGSCNDCSPPPPYCEGDVAVSPRSACRAGECVEEMATLENCAKTQQVCASGACVAADSACATVECTPPAPVCEGDILKRATSATCVEATGQCDVQMSETDCASQGLICSGGACTAGRKRVFVTTNRYNGDFARQGGVRDGAQGAHNICTAEADAAGIGGQWYAFVSDSNREVLEERDRLAFPYYLVDRTTLVSDSGPQLFVNGPLVPIDTTPDGTRLPDVPSELEVWTDTAGTGAVADVVWDCNEWTDGTSGSQGIYGLIDDLDDLPFSSAWTNYDNGLCSDMRRLYCFEL